jgi:uncharacterized protein (TIGR03067 family)
MLVRGVVVLVAVLLAAVVVFGTGIPRRQHAVPSAAGHATSPAPATSSEPGPLTGTWACVSRVVDGEPAPADEASQLKLVARQDELAFVNGDTERAMNYTVDSSARPMTIDLWAKELASEDIRSIHRGIFTVDGDTLTICHGLCRPTLSDNKHVLGADSDRPTDFTAKPGSSRVLTIFKRQKQ